MLSKLLEFLKPIKAANDKNAAKKFPPEVSVHNTDVVLDVK